jgi:N-terminal domain of galactosyltransferase
MDASGDSLIKYSLLKACKLGLNMIKVSFYTTCMGRLHHLKQTLPQNILGNNTNDTQFVLLDYNSNDGLEKWIKENLMPYIKSGKLLYAQEKTAAYFHMSHAKNIAASLCDGDIICSMDADTYTGPALNLILNSMFSKNNDLIVQYRIAGTIAMIKNNFVKLGGYDEEFLGWGNEDLDLVRRGKRMGLSYLKMSSPEFSIQIRHSWQEKHVNDPTNVNDADKHNIKKLRSHDLSGLVRVNPKGFARAKVFINFSLRSTTISYVPPIGKPVNSNIRVGVTEKNLMQKISNRWRAGFGAR